MKHKAFVLPPAWETDCLELATVRLLLAADDTKVAFMPRDFILVPNGRELHLTRAAAIMPETDGFQIGDQEKMSPGVRMTTPLIEMKCRCITGSAGRSTAKVL